MLRKAHRGEARLCSGFSSGIQSVGYNLDKSQPRRAIMAIPRMLSGTERACGWERQGTVVLHPLMGFECSRRVVVQTAQRCFSHNRWWKCKCVTCVMHSYSGLVWFKKQLDNLGQTPASPPSTKEFILAPGMPQPEAAAVDKIPCLWPPWCSFGIPCEGQYAEQGDFWGWPRVAVTS